ncbi:hypothetical protein H4R33_003822 [Dimargaris cristalligena]|nr:hypothetical protein H4R33_003822 [Dimargaris cristalligena]
MAGQGHAELSDHPTSAQTLARRSLTSWPSDFKLGFRDAKFNYTQKFLNEDIGYDDRSRRQKALTYTDDRYNKLLLSGTTRNSGKSLNKLGSKTFSYLTKLAPAPKSTHPGNGQAEQLNKPKPNPVSVKISSNWQWDDNEPRKPTPNQPTSAPQPINQGRPLNTSGGNQ